MCTQSRKVLAVWSGSYASSKYPGKVLPRILDRGCAVRVLEPSPYTRTKGPFNDVAHRVPARSQDGRRRGNLPIICKFTRRMVRDEVLSKRRNCNLLLPATFGLNSENELRISIFSHLTPRLQEIFYLAKSIKEHDNYKYCWAKDTAIYLRKSDNSRAIEITSLQDIEALRHSRNDASSHVNTTR